MKVGIVSFAHMHAHSYANALQSIKGVEFAAIADDLPERGQAAADQYGVRYVGDYPALLAEDIDALIVCTENARHAEVVIAAAKANKHILCEKPIATTLADAQAMIVACRESGVLLQTAFPVRFHPAVQRVKRLLEQGRVGRILAMRGTNRGQNPGGWFVDPALSGGGAVLDHTVHVVDLMRWFTGSEVREVYAEIDTRFHDSLAVDDCGLLTLEFANGVIASHDPSWSRCASYPTWGDVTVEIIGTEGTLSLDVFRQHMLLHSDLSGHTTHENWGDDMDSLLVADFIRSVAERKASPSVTGEDGLRALEVALAAYESATSGQPVRIG
ncbi:Gfo/Idh/MocA family protein [Alicyclobacillus acidiphilus]|uniref:Gfo/Idh/MocA family protein n=1 Tax=Alicyclobacillus acidiphilus TaxID=182455 RepID=UPI00082EEB11|nr:Gfo/Idh/MocA family oxidoreductase [Alicyclobacillus acidiphilus]